MNAGRACWVVPETLCYGLIQGSFGEKFKNCRKCTFYIKVRMEEGINFTMPTALLNMRDARTAARPAADGSVVAETQDVNLQSENADTVT